MFRFDSFTPVHRARAKQRPVADIDSAIRRFDS